MAERRLREVQPLSGAREVSFVDDGRDELEMADLEDARAAFRIGDRGLRELVHAVDYT
jgi:hypothetical protein